MVWFLYKRSNGLKWINTTTKTHKFPDISCHKIPENMQIAEFAGELVKDFGNLFFRNFPKREIIKFVDSFGLVN